MIEMDGDAYLEAVARRRRELGITDEDIAAARNPGDRRRQARQSR